MTSVRDLASLALYDAKGRILMQHRSKTARRMPDHWGFFGGGIEEGETPLQAMLREISEELEYVPSDPVLIFKKRYESSHRVDGTSEYGTSFVYTELYDESQKLIQHEGQALGWFFPDETEHLLVTPHGKAIVAAMAVYLSSLGMDLTSVSSV